MTVTNYAMPGPAFGYAPKSANSGISTLNHSVAATWYAYKWIAGVSDTIANFYALIPAVTGSLSAGDITMTLYDCTGALGVPGTPLETRTTTVPSPITGSSTVHRKWTGFSTPLVAGREYCMVCKNANGTPASNFPGLGIFTSGTGFMGSGGIGTLGFGGNCIMKSTDSGATWASQAVDILPPFAVEYTGGHVDGHFATNLAFFGSSGSGNGRVWATQKAGIRFTSYSNVAINLRTWSFGMEPVGAIGANPQVEVWDVAAGTSVISNVVPKASISTGFGSYPLFTFNTPVIIKPGQDTRIVLSCDSNTGDGSTTYYQLRSVTLENIALNTGSIGFIGTMNSTIYNGTTWADGNKLNQIMGYGLCDFGNEFAPRTVFSCVA